MDVAVIGGSGYTGAELLRWILGHPEFALSLVTSDAEAGRPVAAIHPALAASTDAVFEPVDAATIASRAKLAFLAVPHTAAMAIVPSLLDAGLTVIDLSADFRLSDASIYEHWYGVTHAAPDLLAKAVYGLPEADRSGLLGAKLVAVPGCYPTATALAALPALETAGLWDGRPVHVDAKSGVTGAGKGLSPGSHFVAANESVLPYKVGTHRHTPEIEQTLGRAANESVPVVFAPHLVPLSRGLLSTVYLGMAREICADEAVEMYRARYAGEPFVRVLEAGSMPSTAEVRGTNRAVIGVTVDERTSTLIAACALDNLGKGAASQAIQCANAVLGLPEDTGLTSIGPVI
ncbi:MAG: N-acetyl-gamma-glutamyl-phosphate reductase [Coriobacteriia bacterium]|nr:N-acetyl-gamma-glutamyl-phosphate reductase [Coriobacteriia bacterium]